MMYSYEAEVSEDGKVRLRESLTLDRLHKAVLTVLEPLENTDIEPKPSNITADWRRFAGILKDSLHFKDDPIAVQKAMRDEWD